MFHLLISISSLQAGAAEPPGATQPGELLFPLEPSSGCESCHAGFAQSAVDTFAGTMMANAMRDPMFLAGLTIANQDLPGIGDFCLRCHTPPGWLEGRCAPGDTSLLLPVDFEDGISCDTCHRMTVAPEGPLIANAVYTVVDNPAKRGTFETDMAPHDTVVDSFLTQSEYCGVCHEVSNPLFGDFPIERTYSEWAASSFATDPEGTCQACHLPVEPGYVADTVGVELRDVHIHRFVGGNTWMPEVIAGEDPSLDQDAHALVIEASKQLLRETAIVTVEPSLVGEGTGGTIVVKVENLGGHKLPTGYPEGRRAWLEVVVADANGLELLRSGTYDPVEATIADDPQLRKYEARLGHDGEYSYHMVLQDELLFDSRIPPRGFRPTPDLQPVGVEFEVQPDGSLANYDLAPYELVPPPEAVGPLTVSAKLWYQTTTREFMEFLRDENVTDDSGQYMYDLWVKYGKDAPVLMTEVTATVELQPPGLLDGFGDDDEPFDPTPCGCDGAGSSAGWLSVGLLAWLRRTRRSTSRAA